MQYILISLIKIDLQTPQRLNLANLSLPRNLRIPTHLIPIDTVAFSKITGSSSRTVVRAGRRYTLGFGHDQGDLVWLQLIVIHRKEPTSSIQILKQANVHHHRFHDRSLDQHMLVRATVTRSSLCRRRFHETDRLRTGISFQSMIHSTTFHKFHKIILRDTWRDISPSVDGKVRAPGQSKIQSDEGRLLVPELSVPEMVRRDHGRVSHVVRLELEHRRPLLG